MTHASRVHKYARWAARPGNKQVCKWVRLAAERHLKDLERSRRDPGWPYVWSDFHANHVCQFLELLPHIEGIWETPNITLEDWQCFGTGSVFGWRRREDETVRRFNTVYEEYARKNAKSTKVSGISLYCLCCEGEIGPQVKTAATTGDQARIVFDVASRMASKTPDLLEAFDLEVLKNAIVCHKNGGNIKPINAKASTQDGLNPHLTIIDELHAHKDRRLFDVLKSARGARKNPLSWYITTAGYDTQGVCYEQRTFLTKILEGVIEADHYFGVIYTLDGHDIDPEYAGDDEAAQKEVVRDDEFDPKNWIKANPNLGVSVSVDEFKTYAQEAQLSPDSHTEFLTKRLNIWTSAKHVWTNVPLWKRCNGAVDLEVLRDEPCFAGLDLASTQDMCAFRLAWIVGDRLKTWGRYYLPESTIEQRSKHVPYKRWVREGWITSTPGDVTDYEYIQQDIEAALTRFTVKGIAYDPWNALDLVNRLMAKNAPMTEFPQQISRFTGGMRALQRYYLSGNFDHAGDPVLTWNASNIVARRDANDNVAPDRKNSQEKIDGFVALVMAVSMLTAQEPEPEYTIHLIGAGT